MADLIGKDRKALTMDRTPDGLWKLVEVTIPADGRRRVTYRDLSEPTSLRAAVGHFDLEIYRLFYPK